MTRVMIDPESSSPFGLKPTPPACRTQLKTRFPSQVETKDSPAQIKKPRMKRRWVSGVIRSSDVSTAVMNAPIKPAAIAADR